MALPTKSPNSILRSDFEFYKTQVAICAWCGLFVIVCLTGAVIYAFILIRKNKKQFEEKLKMTESLRTFTIDRPKLLPWYDPLSKFQSEATKKSSFDYTGLSRPQSKSVPSPLPSPLPSLSNYENANSPRPWSKNGNDSSFLNKNRELFIAPKGGESPSPRTPNTPGNGNKNGHFF